MSRVLPFSPTSAQYGPVGAKLSPGAIYQPNGASVGFARLLPRRNRGETRGDNTDANPAYSIWQAALYLPQNWRSCHKVPSVSHPERTFRKTMLGVGRHQRKNAERYHPAISASGGGTHRRTSAKLGSRKLVRKSLTAQILRARPTLFYALCSKAYSETWRKSSGSNSNPSD